MESPGKPSSAPNAGEFAVAQRSLEIAKRGIASSADFTELMSALMSDIVEGSVTPEVANAAVNAGGKLLKACELQLKYGVPSQVNGKRVLSLVG